MRVFHGFEALPKFRHPSATVGSYDGVHLGHQALIEQLNREARSRGGESIVLTFEPHPRITLGRSEGLQLLTTLDEKLALLEQLGVDNVIIIPFNQDFSALSGREFIDQYLIGRLGVETLVAGYNHRFGHDRIDCKALADSDLLRIIEVGECVVGDRRVSSTVIRQLIANGEVAAAQELLGRTLKATTHVPILIEQNPQRDAELIERLTTLWQESVEATHHFLQPSDVEALRPFAAVGIAQIETLLVARRDKCEVAFMGVDNQKIEMLFVSPTYFGRGIGAQLIALALDKLGVQYVDVNEQNKQAEGFYCKMGFEVYDRSEFDDQGNPFPILKMKIKTEK